MSESRPLQGPPQGPPRPPLQGPPHQGPPLQGPPRPAMAPAQPAGPAKIVVPPPATHKPTEAELEPISLVDEPAAAQGTPSTPSKIKAFVGAGPTVTTHNYKRQPTLNGQGAVRVRSFHGRLSEEGLAYMDEKINEWIDQHPEVEVKFVTTTIGTFEGKIREPSLVVNIWY